MYKSNGSARMVLGAVSILLCLAAVLRTELAAAAPRRRSDDVVKGRRVAANEVLVRYRQPPGKQQQISSDDPDIDDERPIGAGRWRRLHSRSRSAEALANAMVAHPALDRVELNYVVSVTGTPDDLIAPLWGLRNTGQRLDNGEFGTPGVDIDANHAWDVTQGSRRLVVGLVDTGVLATHGDLAANMWTAPRPFTVVIGGVTISCAAGTHGFNAITRACDPTDDHGHGTHVAGSIGAVGNNGTGVVGVNWTTSMMALKFIGSSGSGYLSDAIDAIEFAIQTRLEFASTGEANVRVLNNSWSGGPYSLALSDEIQRANDADMLFVAAAGNNATNHDTIPTYPSDYPIGNVLSVAATDYRDAMASFSDYGAEHVHVAAPGVIIYSTMRSGDGSADYGTMSGTSMATAYASGIASLVLSHCSYSTGALRDALMSTTIPVAALSGRVQSGGRLNAARAVTSCDKSTAASDIVIYAADIATGDRHGAWELTSDVSAAGGVAIRVPDAGWATTSAPLAHPSDYFDVRFSAPAGIPYRVWLRLQATGDSKWNDSVWLQFSDAIASGAPAYAINSSEGLLVNLENCSGCGVAGWGWQDGAYWLPRTTISFASSGSHTLRIQTREDGAQIDQIVISPSTWLSSSPGQLMSDSTIVARVPSIIAPPPSPRPVSGTPGAIPGVIEAENFDDGGEGIAYHDVSTGNSGGAYRATDVDIEPTAGGGFNIGWVSGGEWLAYTVNVAASATYTVQFVVASNGPGGRFHLEAGGVNVTGSLTVPDTGGWQSWQTLSTTAALQSGPQLLRLMMEGSGGIGNFDRFVIVPRTSSPIHIEAVDFDNGGEGVSYHDTSAGNSGGGYRSTDVDIEASSGGGYNVGWIDTGEWLRYTIDVPSSGSYLIRLSVASPEGNGAIHVKFGDRDVTGEITLPRTGAWQEWTTISVPATLDAGRQTMTLSFTSPGFNVRWVELTPP